MRPWAVGFIVFCFLHVSVGEDLPRVENITRVQGGSIFLSASPCVSMGVWSFYGNDKETTDGSRILYWDKSCPDRILQTKYKSRVSPFCNGTLSMKNLTKEDEGWYQWECEQTPKIHIYLRIADPISSVSIVSSTSGLHCNFTGEASSVLWFRNNKSITEGLLDDNRTLSVTSGLEREEIVCVILDAQGRMIRTSIDPISSVSIVSSTSGLHCNFTGEASSVLWFRNNKSITEGLLDDNRTLSVTSMLESEEIVCVILDTQGRTIRTSIVIFLDAPTKWFRTWRISPLIVFLTGLLVTCAGILLWRKKICRKKEDSCKKQQNTMDAEGLQNENLKLRTDEGNCQDFVEMNILGTGVEDFHNTLRIDITENEEEINKPLLNIQVVKTDQETQNVHTCEMSLIADNCENRVESLSLNNANNNNNGYMTKSELHTENGEEPTVKLDSGQTCESSKCEVGSNNHKEEDKPNIFKYNLIDETQSEVLNKKSFKNYIYNPIFHRNKTDVGVRGMDLNIRSYKEDVYKPDLKMDIDNKEFSNRFKDPYNVSLNESHIEDGRCESGLNTGSLIVGISKPIPKGNNIEEENGKLHLNAQDYREEICKQVLNNCVMEDGISDLSTRDCREYMSNQSLNIHNCEVDEGNFLLKARRIREDVSKSSLKK
ncbi:uncharacterized protein O3C94_004308 isoform 2-T2 [Discoglossus pictus]